ncbi:hypothetical protein FOD75_11180 (plasmid) [Limosilactobacillus reuteri]|uniref:Uncharacterized protein n=1 Tax=Limosilactobacillus reuteri TaxID=1598 RepID=A0A517D8H8_LIMRT|nr:hypothetical protein [Limosilactobacillus reuteri]QDR73649.1 hypothetical protein FOD75_11180 [Limosilactobacillus reuteri]
MGKHGNKKHNTTLTNMFGLKRWNQLSKADKIMNSTLAIMLSIVLVGCLIAFVPHHLKNNTEQEAVTNSKVITHKREKNSKPDKLKTASNDNPANEDAETLGSTSYNRGPNQSASNSLESNTQSNSNDSQSKSRKNLGEVSNGMNADYRMAARAGLVSGNGDPDEVKNFYNNVQDNSNNSFTYNGKTVYFNRTHEGNPNGVVVNGEHYTDPDRFTVTVDQ